MRSIYVQSQFVAFHKWDAAPKDTSFLRDWHRHIFKVRVDLMVTHDNRDLEFFEVLERLNVVLNQWREQKVNKSCEMFCDSISEALKYQYPTLFRVEVSEDGENGAILSLHGTILPLEVGSEGPITVE